MKRTFIAIFVLALLVGVFGCSFNRTYSYTVGGICVEIVTSDRDVMRAAEQAGYERGPCSSMNILGVCANYAEVGGDTFSAYFYDTYYTLSDAELSCQLIGGTWSAN